MSYVLTNVGAKVAQHAESWTSRLPARAMAEGCNYELVNIDGLFNVDNRDGLRSPQILHYLLTGGFFDSGYLGGGICQAIPTPVIVGGVLLREMRAAPLEESKLAGPRKEILAQLENAKLVRREEVNPGEYERIAQRYRYNPLEHVDMLALEATYNCSRKCPHCCQRHLSDKFPAITPFEKFQEAIRQAATANIKAVAFTGGEVTLANIDIFALIEHAKSLGIPSIVLETNGWWLRNTGGIKIWGRDFKDPAELMFHLKEAGVTQMMLSLHDLEDDFFYASKVQARPKTLELIRRFDQMAELQGFTAVYPLVGPSSKVLCERLPALNRVLNRARNTHHARGAGKFHYGIPTNMGAAYIPPNLTEEAHPKDSEYRMKYCFGKLYRPKQLIVGPHGAVRMCYFGMGPNMLGNINTASLTDIMNGYQGSRVYQFFTTHPIEEILAGSIQEIAEYLPEDDLYNKGIATRCEVTRHLAVALAYEEMAEVFIGRPLTSSEKRSIAQQTRTLATGQKVPDPPASIAPIFRPDFYRA